jgi:hypothetical protein
MSLDLARFLHQTLDSLLKDALAPPDQSKSN